MKNHPAQRLLGYLKTLKSTVSEIDVNRQIFKEGTKASQVAFHASQSANFFLRVRISGGEFPRDKDSELTSDHDVSEINKSIDLAIQATQDLIDKDLDLNEKLKEEINMGDFVIDSVGGGLIFVTAHTSEHLAQLVMLHDANPSF
ncbi:MAG TPA: hypothetical protein VG965_07130 [Patescibacteria group bacterium]|nr:hypothetical protein [Patescibacteria group bacterium]